MLGDLLAPSGAYGMRMRLWTGIQPLLHRMRATIHLARPPDAPKQRISVPCVVLSFAAGRQILAQEGVKIRVLFWWFRNFRNFRNFQKKEL